MEYTLIPPHHTTLQSHQHGVICSFPLIFWMPVNGYWLISAGSENGHRHQGSSHRICPMFHLALPMFYLCLSIVPSGFTRVRSLFSHVLSGFAILFISCSILFFHLVLMFHLFFPTFNLVFQPYMISVWADASDLIVLDCQRFFWRERNCFLELLHKSREYRLLFFNGSMKRQ